MIETILERSARGIDEARCGATSGAWVVVNMLATALSLHLYRHRALRRAVGQ